jgi:hypothetical protein
MVAGLVGIILFILTSFSDPGTINSENVSRYISAYPYDGIIYFEKQCTTCNIPRLSFPTCVLALSSKFKKC